MSDIIRLGAVVAAAVAIATAGCSRPEEQEISVTGKAENPVVVIQTSAGEIKVELLADKCPATVANFLRYVDAEFYDGRIFHRVKAGFMIQGGGMDAKMQEKQTGSPIRNEATARVPNARGTLAMARTGDPHSATAQFFINLVDNAFLDHRDTSVQGYGYCAFGRVTEGMDVVDRIGKVQTHSVAGHDDVPVTAVTIESIRRAK